MLLSRAENSRDYENFVKDRKRRIKASLHAFAGRRFIDAGEHRKAVGRLLKALYLDPPVFLRYWYKGVQASLSAIGLEKVFLAYRKLRRRIQHGGKRVALTDQGAVLKEALHPDDR
jgi:hypothetical protein